MIFHVDSLREAQFRNVFRERRYRQEREVELKEKRAESSSWHPQTVIDAALYSIRTFPEAVHPMMPSPPAFVLSYSILN
jgi:hypothetical protein